MKMSEEMKTEEMQFEQAMTRLEKIVSALERGDTSLEESLKLFQEGTALIQHCSKALDQAQQQVKLLTLTESGLQQVPFEAKEN